MTAFPRLAADPGRIVANRDVRVGMLMLALFEPPERLHSSDAPILLLAASTPSPGWKRQYVEVHHAGRTQLVQTPPRKSVLGQVLTELDITESDDHLDVVLHDPEQWLVSCSAEDLSLGENFAAIGGEVVQFGEAAPLGNGRFRLGRLQRARAGTVSALHSKGDPFVLLEHGTLRPIILPVWKHGSPVWASAQDGSSQCSVTPAFKGLAPAGLRLTL